MKKTGLLTFALLAGLSLLAQRHRAVSTYTNTAAAQFGLKGGLNIADLKDAGFPVTDSRIGYHVGAFVHIHINPEFAIQPEVIYSAQGAKYNYNRKNGTSQIDYVNIPIMFQYMFGSGLRLETGPQFGILANAKFKYNDDSEADVKNEYKSTEASWGFGLGYKSFSGLGIDARYNIGLTNISFTGDNIKNQVWQIGLFYQFRQ